jgi:hypothetical protein
MNLLPQAAGFYRDELLKLEVSPSDARLPENAFLSYMLIMMKIIGVY